MFDSGAFSAFNSKTGINHITLSNYIDFLHTFGRYAEKYVMLDAIGNATQTRENYLQMLKANLNPMWVVTMYDNDYNFLRTAVSNNQHICVAGGATTKGEWMSQKFLRIFKESEEKAKIHGLAYVTTPNIYRLPLASIDSSTWTSGGRYGWLCCWNTARQKFDRVCFKDLKTKPIPSFLLSSMNEIGITIDDLDRKKDLAPRQIADKITSLGYIKFQESAYARGRKLFLAIGNREQLQLYLNVLEIHTKKWKH